MSDPAASPRRLLHANLALLATALFWGTHIPASWILLATYQPLEVTIGRYGLAVPLLFLLLSIETKATGAAPEKRSLFTLWLLGGVGIFGFALSYTAGLGMAGQIQGALVSASAPAVGVAVAWAMKGLRPDGPMRMALALALAGALVGILGGHDVSQMTLPGIGEALMIFGNVMWSWYSLAAQDRLRGWSQIRIATWTIAMAGATAFALAVILILLGLIRVPPMPDATNALILAYLVVAPTILGILGWNFGVRALGLPIASLYLNLVPVTAVLTAVALGEAPNLWQLLGGTLIVAGIAQGQYRRLRAAR